MKSSFWRQCRRLRLEALEDRAVPASFQGLGFLPGYDSSNPAGISADGTVVVGINGSETPFRWTAGGGMVGLGSLPGYSGGAATGASSDGSVVVGYSGVNPYEAFRWTA